MSIIYCTQRGDIVEFTDCLYFLGYYMMSVVNEFTNVHWGVWCLFFESIQCNYELNGNGTLFEPKQSKTDGMNEAIDLRC